MNSPITNGNAESHVRFGIYDGDPWVTRRTEPAVRVAYVYTVIKANQGAFESLQLAQQNFLNDFNDELRRVKALFWASHLQGKAGLDMELESHLQDLIPWSFETEADRLFKNWANDGWAKNPKAVTKPLRIMAMNEVFIDFMGFNQRRLYRNKRLLKKMWPEQADSFRALLSPERKRAEQALRAEGARHLRDKGYRRPRQNELTNNASAWYLSRIVEMPFEKIVHLHTSVWADAKQITADQQNFSSVILKPFDDALHYPRVVGKPEKMKPTSK